MSAQQKAETIQAILEANPGQWIVFPDYLLEGFKMVWDTFQEDEYCNLEIDLNHENGKALRIVYLED